MALRLRQFPSRRYRPTQLTSLGPQNKRNVRRVVAVMVPGITPPTLGIPQPALSANLPFSLALPPAVAGAETAAPTSLLPVFQSLFSHACPTRAPGEKNKMHSCYQAFTNCPLTGGEKERRERARKEREWSSGEIRLAHLLTRFSCT